MHTNDQPKYWLTTCDLIPTEALPMFEEALSPLSDALMTQEKEDAKGDGLGLWRLEALSTEMPSQEELAAAFALAAKVTGFILPDFSLTRLENKDWLQECFVSFPPVEVDRFYIYGSHLEAEVPTGKIGLCVDAATAFGSGEHQTTQGCLTGLSYLMRQGHKAERILDMGCGSGILSLAAAKALKKPILAVDIDPESARVTAENAKLNKVARYIQAETGAGYKAPSVKKTAPFDLVFANILARPLTQMAKDLSISLAPSGVAILSGLLTRQEQWVLSAHRQVGLHLIKRIRIDGWSTLIVGRR